MSHLLPGKVSEVPSHIRKPMQDALQSVPLSDYSPLDHYSGAFDKLAVRLCCALPTSCTLAQSQGSDICGKSPSTVELVFLCTGFEMLSMMPFDVTAAFHPRLLSICNAQLRFVQGLVSQSLVRSTTPPHTRPASAPGHSASPVPHRQAAPLAPLKQKVVPAMAPQTAGTKLAAPQAQQVSYCKGLFASLEITVARTSSNQQHRRLHYQMHVSKVQYHSQCAVLLPLLQTLLHLATVMLACCTARQIV